ncbi:hypothetical protein D9M72_448220 [compost metagenome]
MSEVDAHEKKKLRDQIGEHLDVSAAQLTDDEAVFLRDFIDDYGEVHRGNSKTRTRRQDSWSSDGKYTREETFTDTFTDEIGIQRDYYPGRMSGTPLIASPDTRNSPACEWSLPTS